MALRRRSASIGCRYRVRRGIRRTVNNKAGNAPAYPLEIIMLLDNVTLSDYSNDELEHFIEEAKRTINKRNSEQTRKQIAQFSELFGQLKASVYFTCEDADGYTYIIKNMNIISEGMYPEISFSVELDG